MACKRLLLAALLAMLMSGTALTTRGVEAQTVPAPDFWVTLFNSDTRTFVRLDITGSRPPVEFPLSLPDEFANLTLHPSAYSPDGSLLALCFDPDDNPYEPNDLALLIYRIAAGAAARRHDIPGALYCDVQRAGWSDDGSNFVFGVLNHLGDKSGPGWAVEVLDVSGGQVVNRLAADDPALAAFPANTGGVFPLVRASLPERSVAFVMAPFGVGGPPGGETLVWNLEDGRVESGPYYGGEGLEVLPGRGEMIWLEEAAAYAGISPIGPGPTFNVVKASDSSGATRAIYINTGRFIAGAKFVQDGRKLAVQTYNVDFTEDEWTVIDRTGSAASLPVKNTLLVNLVGTPDGYLALKTEGAAAQLEHHVFVEGAITPQVSVIWRAPGANWTLAARRLQGDLAEGPLWPDVAP